MNSVNMGRLFIILAAITLGACQNNTTTETPMTAQPYGNISGKEILQYTLQNKSGLVLKVINYGCTITDILVPDKAGNVGNVVLGFDSLEGYLQKENPYIGPIIGRYANRIQKAVFKIGNQEYKLGANNNGNTLHGGLEGFNRKVWEVKSFSDSSITMRYHSPDGEEGFPGNVQLEVVMSIGADNSVRLEYSATTDKPTPVSFTNHSYFNLSYGNGATILDHELMIMANSITPVDSLLIPTGELTSVKNTSFDFTTSKKIGAELEQVPGGAPGGYDHNFVLNKNEDELALAAVLYDPHSGRKLELLTTEPGVQFYSGNFMDGSITGKDGIVYVKHAGLCLEPQHFPDSPNQPSFPNTILQPGQRYKQTSIFRFSVQKAH